MANHRWYKPSIHRFAWLVCACCGLVKLSNDRTVAAVRKKCEGADD